MAMLDSRGQLKGGIVHWSLERHHFEFTLEEFQEIVSEIQRTGLFKYLERERPALRDQLMSIGRSLPEFQNEDDAAGRDLQIEFVLEQCLLHLMLKLR